MKVESVPGYIVKVSFGEVLNQDTFMENVRKAMKQAEDNRGEVLRIEVDLDGYELGTVFGIPMVRKPQELPEL